MSHQSGRMESHGLRSPWPRLRMTVKKVRELILDDMPNPGVVAVSILVCGVSMADIASWAGISRQDLYHILTVRRVMHRKRRLVEGVINVPPGGLSVILAPLEDHLEQTKGVSHGSV